MVRITRKILKNLVIVDTNILVNKDVSMVASFLFDSFWSKYSKDCNLELYIPQVVLGELTFQHFKEASNSYKDIISQINNIAKIAQKKYSHTISEPSLKQKINNKFKRWLSSKKATILQTPTKKIDWDKLIEMSIWREPPFSFEEREKGFRDCLIMETVDSFCKENKHEVNITFICNDNLLCEGVNSRLKSDKRFKLFQTLADFENYLKLEKEQLDKKFIIAVLGNASKKFFQRDDQKSLYYKEKIREKMLPDVEKYIKNPENAQSVETNPLSGLLGLTVGTQPIQAWEQVGSGTFWISNPEINEIAKDHYSWISKINYVRWYQRRRTTLLTLNFYEERLLILNFEVDWKAKITKDARFYDVKFGNISLSGTSFDKPTQEQIQQWGAKPETPQQ